MAAPQATLMKTIIEGVLAGALPWGLVLTGGGITIGAMLWGVSGLAFAMGVYVHMDAGVGGRGIPAASGLVAGEGLAGVFMAALVAGGLAPRSMEPRLAGLAGELGCLAIIALFCWFLDGGGRDRG